MASASKNRIDRIIYERDRVSIMLVKPVLVLLQKTGKRKQGARDENNQSQVSKAILGLVTKTILGRGNTGLN